MVNSITSGGGGNIANLIQQIQPNNGNPQTNSLNQTQQNQHAQPKHQAATVPATPTPTVNTLGQQTGLHVNTRA
jgi:hypothetical protein